MNELFAGAMTPEVFAWNAASNNQGINAGELSYILNSISAYRTAQDEGLEVADDILFTPALEGGDGIGRLTCDVQLDRPRCPRRQRRRGPGVPVALRRESGAGGVAFQALRLPGIPRSCSRPVRLGGRRPVRPTRRTSCRCSTRRSIGRPISAIPANPAIGQIFGESIIPVMFADAAQGNKTPQEALADAETQINAISTIGEDGDWWGAVDHPVSWPS